MTETAPGKALEFRAWQHVAIFLAACVIVISRRPDSVFHAQFYGEDGAIWFAQAYNWGPWRPFYWSYNGYLHLLPRVAAAAALLVPLQHAPLIENLVAISFEALPVNLLLSSRSSAWGTLRFRIALAAIYLVLPNTGEMIGTVTETQWFLALCAFLLILAKPPDSLGRKIFDIALLLLSGFTGPFCFVLLLIAVTLPKAATGRWRRVVTGIFLAGSTVQLCELILNHSHRYSLALGATPQLFIQILGSQVYFGTLLGSNVLASMLPLKVVLVAIIAGSLIVACGGILSPVMRRFILLTAILFLAALASPTTAQFPGKSAWQLLARSPGARYWFLPTLTFAWSIAFCLQSKKQLLRIAAFPLAVVMLFGIVRNYRCPAFADTQFAQNVAHFQTLPKGSKQSIQVTPAEWKMVLIKR